MMGEYGVSAIDVKAETIWLSPEVGSSGQIWGGDDGVGGYAPLAIATGTGGATLYWVYGSHLGVPIVTTDSAGNLAAPTGFTREGFPGQTQTLADLYYNRYRDYDPTTGRYIEADPIGLNGGQNNYAYADNDPINEVDPMGLMGHGAYYRPRVPRPRQPRPPCPKPPPPKPFPSEWHDTSWSQIWCILSTMAAGPGPIAADVHCHTDWTKQNPDNAKNAEERKEDLDKEREEAKEKIDDLDHEREKEDVERRVKEAERED